MTRRSGVSAPRSVILSLSIVRPFPLEKDSSPCLKGSLPVAVALVSPDLMGPLVGHLPSLGCYSVLSGGCSHAPSARPLGLLHPPPSLSDLSPSSGASRPLARWLSALSPSSVSVRPLAVLWRLPASRSPPVTLGLLRPWCTVLSLIRPPPVPALPDLSTYRPLALSPSSSGSSRPLALPVSAGRHSPCICEWWLQLNTSGPFTEQSSLLAAAPPAAGRIYSEAWDGGTS